MIRLRTPEQAPEDVPRKRDILRFPGSRNTQRSSTPNEVSRLRQRVSDLEIDRRALREQLRRQRGGRTTGGATEKQSAAVPVAEDVQVAVIRPESDALLPSPTSLAATAALVMNIGVLKSREHADPSVTPQIDAHYRALSTATFTDSNADEAATLMEELTRLQEVEYQDHPERQKYISAVIRTLSPLVPKDAGHISGLMAAIAPLKQQEIGQRGYSAALDAKIMTAYRALADCVIDSAKCKPADATRLLKDAKKMKGEEFHNTGGPRGAVYMARHEALDTFIGKLQAVEQKGRGKGIWGWIPGFGTRKKAA